MKDTTRDKFLTELEVEEWFKIPVATLRTMRSRPGKDPIPFVKMGRLVRYRESDLLKWITRNTWDDAGDALASKR